MPNHDEIRHLENRISALSAALDEKNAAIQALNDEVDYLREKLDENSILVSSPDPPVDGPVDSPMDDEVRDNLMQSS